MPPQTNWPKNRLCLLCIGRFRSNRRPPIDLVFFLTKNRPIIVTGNRLANVEPLAEQNTIGVAVLVPKTSPLFAGEDLFTHEVEASSSKPASRLGFRIQGGPYRPIRTVDGENEIMSEEYVFYFRVVS